MNYTETAVDESISRTMEAIGNRGIRIELVETRDEALTRITELLPDGASFATAASATLHEIGFVKEIKSGNHGWRDLTAEVRAENDPEKRLVMRRQNATADYVLGSVAAIAETGEIVVASGSGSQLAPYLGSPNVIWVAGTQKIVPTLEDALRRTREYCAPRVEEWGKKVLGRGGAGTIGRLLIFENEAAHLRRNVNLILVNEPLGF